MFPSAEVSHTAARASDPEPLRGWAVTPSTSPHSAWSCPGHTLTLISINSASPSPLLMFLLISSLPATSVRFLGQLEERESCQHWYIRNTIQAAAICVLFLDDFIFFPLRFHNIIHSPGSNNICCIKSKLIWIIKFASFHLYFTLVASRGVVLLCPLIFHEQMGPSWHDFSIYNHSTGLKRINCNCSTAGFTCPCCPEKQQGVQPLFPALLPAPYV